jgi:hypothetical protein
MGKSEGKRKKMAWKIYSKWEGTIKMYFKTGREGLESGDLA